MTTEEKARQYAYNNSTAQVFINPDVKVDISKQIQTAYLAGAAETLGQWHSLDETPPEGSDIAIAYEANGLDGKRGWFKCIIKYHKETGFIFLEESLKGFDLNIHYWMELPPLPNTEEQ